MEIELFTRVYTAQIALGELLETLLQIEYPDKDFIHRVKSEIDIILSDYENTSMDSMHLLKNPPSAYEAYTIHERFTKGMIERK